MADAFGNLAPRQITGDAAKQVVPFDAFADNVGALNMFTDQNVSIYDPGCVGNGCFTIFPSPSGTVYFQPESWSQLSTTLGTTIVYNSSTALASMGVISGSGRCVSDCYTLHDVRLYPDMTYYTIKPFGIDTGIRIPGWVGPLFAGWIEDAVTSTLNSSSVKPDLDLALEALYGATWNRSYYSLGGWVEPS